MLLAFFSACSSIGSKTYHDAKLCLQKYWHGMPAVWRSSSNLSFFFSPVSLLVLRLVTTWHRIQGWARWYWPESIGHTCPHYPSCNPLDSSAGFSRRLVLLRDLRCFVKAGGIGLDVGAVSLDFCIEGTRRDGQLVLLGEALLFLWLADWDLGLPCSSDLAGKASAVVKDVGLATVPVLAMVGGTSSLGFGEALNRSYEPFGNPPGESSMVAGGNQEGSIAYW